jgi:hypothetical protein
MAKPISAPQDLEIPLLRNRHTCMRNIFVSLIERNRSQLSITVQKNVE